MQSVSLVLRSGSRERHSAFRQLSHKPQHNATTPNSPEPVSGSRDSTNSGNQNISAAPNPQSPASDSQKLNNSKPATTAPSTLHTSQNASDNGMAHGTTAAEGENSVTMKDATTNNSQNSNPEPAAAAAAATTPEKNATKVTDNTNTVSQAVSSGNPAADGRTTAVADDKTTGANNQANDANAGAGAEAEVTESQPQNPVSTDPKGSTTTADQSDTTVTKRKRRLNKRRLL
ncbi:hypothetical protein WMY93_007511 [Mugilogobius chulae]|uniref:Uncharacterized protein n=1 Tax=Mugilogobius chulae TaxID=88201 RepID=A0AAW0PDD6_9GOBI